MKPNHKLNLLGELMLLHYFQLHLTTVMVAVFIKEKNDFSQLDELVCKIEDAKAVIDWFHAHTPVRFNRKKKRFVLRRSRKWNIHSGLFSDILIGKPALLKYRNKYRLKSVDDISRVLDMVSAHMDELNSKYQSDHSTISLSEVEQIPEKSDREKIKEYLAANPAPDSLRKFGIPQSKYRYGTYGMPTYDQWSR